LAYTRQVRLTWGKQLGVVFGEKSGNLANSGGVNINELAAEIGGCYDRPVLLVAFSLDNIFPVRLHPVRK
jgi:hypothetical protein